MRAAKGKGEREGERERRRKKDSRAAQCGMGDEAKKKNLDMFNMDLEQRKTTRKRSDTHQSPLGTGVESLRE
jgi:hypothetical protein